MEKKRPGHVNMNKQERKRENLQQNPRKNMKNKEGKRGFFTSFPLCIWTRGKKNNERQKE